MADRPAPIRRALTWWFAWPANPWVSVSFAADASAALPYARSVGVTMNALLAACVGRTLAENPRANGRMVGDQIVLEDRVGIAMPVNLLGHDAKNELSLAVVPAIDRMTLRELGEATRDRIREERAGKPADPVVRTILGLARHAPGPVFRGALRAADRALRVPAIGRVAYRQMGVTTGLSNVGAAFGAIPGVAIRGAAISPPQRMVQVGTFWGASVAQEEAVVVDGAVAIRPMIPMILLFDHRLVDGVGAGRLVESFGLALRDPAAAFGGEGEGRVGR